MAARKEIFWGKTVLVPSRRHFFNCLLGVGLCGCGRIAVPPRLAYDVVFVTAHDSSAYTEGLVFLGGVLFESTGEYGRSALRKLDPATGTVLQSVSQPAGYFSEGLAAVDSELVQLTWRSGVATVYNARSLDVVRTYQYQGEGWGLCYDGHSLFMSNGSDTLYERSPGSFAVVARHPITSGGHPVTRLNELECVGRYVWANVFPTDEIIRIDKGTGQATARVDARGLAARSQVRDSSDAVLNGIAYDPDRGAYIVTGKRWLRMYSLRIEASGG